MKEPYEKKPSWHHRLVGGLLADRRKVAALIVAVTVLGVVAGRIIVRQAGPANVRADETATVNAGQSGAGTDAPPTHSTRQADPAGRWAKAKITRDIFRINEALLPPDDGNGATPMIDNAGADGSEEFQQRMRRIRAEEADLVLQSTIVGTSPTAIINDRVVRVGETIGGFRVIEVTARNCVVEKNEVKVRLYMGGRMAPSGRSEAEGKTSSPPKEKSSAV